MVSFDVMILVEQNEPLMDSFSTFSVQILSRKTDSAAWFGLAYNKYAPLLPICHLPGSCRL